MQTNPLNEKRLHQLNQAAELKKLPIAKLISLFENRSEGTAQQRHDIIHHINNNPKTFTGKGVTIGFTGTPGAGKSSLIAELCKKLTKNSDLRIAVLAIDPSSQSSGGAILGDRTRMHSGSKNRNLFFRSQASNLELGGITHNTFQATRLLRYLFDLIIIETVGIGQNEIDIQYMSDHTFLLMQPLAGDQIQFMKAGIMEIPDSFVVNKCDEERLARTSYHMLRASLKQSKLIILNAKDNFENAAKDNIFLTSATKNKGIQELADFIQSIQRNHLNEDDLNGNIPNEDNPNGSEQNENCLRENKKPKDIESFYLQKAIQELYGKFGLGILSQEHDSLKQLSGYEEKMAFAIAAIEQHILRR
jgi:LAO/AO transport system kinase